MRLVTAFLILVLLPGCAVFLQRAPAIEAQQADSTVNWKERIEQPYLYLEHRGDYRRFGETLVALLQQASDAGIEASGPPFGLYYDDPGEVRVAELRSRACLPVTSGTTARGGLSHDVLPRAMVVYARVRGGRPHVQQAYPSLMRFAGERNWEVKPPVREVYMMQSAAGDAGPTPVTEVQMPWRGTR